MLKVEAKAQLRALQDLVKLQRFNPGSEFYIERFRNERGRFSERFRNERGRFSEDMLAEVGVKHHGARLAKVMIERKQVEPICDLAGCSSVSVEELLAKLTGDHDAMLSYERDQLRTDSYDDW